MERRDSIEARREWSQVSFSRSPLGNLSFHVLAVPFPLVRHSAWRVLIEQAGGNENLVRCSFRAIFLPTSHLRKGETTWNMERGTWNVPLNVGIYCPRISEAGQERERRGLSPRSGMKTRTIFQRDPRGNRERERKKRPHISGCG